MSERLRAPANAIVATLVVGVIFLFLWAFPVLKWIGLDVARPELRPGPRRQAQPGRLGLVHDPRLGPLAGSCPGINAILARRSPGPTWSRTLRGSAGCRCSGVVWLVFALILYWFAGVGPIYNALTRRQEALAYLNSSGVTFVVIVHGDRPGLVRRPGAGATGGPASRRA